jgi:hypothetical protein
MLGGNMKNYYKTTFNGIKLVKGCHVEVVSPNTLSVVHYNIEILRKEGNIYTLKNGGHFSHTTKKMINRLLPEGYYLKQKDSEWFIKTIDGKVIEWREGVTFIASIIGVEVHL